MLCRSDWSAKISLFLDYGSFEHALYFYLRIGPVNINCVVKSYFLFIGFDNVSSDFNMEFSHLFFGQNIILCSKHSFVSSTFLDIL